jgi:hypothetical protein
MDIPSCKLSSSCCDMMCYTYKYCTSLHFADMMHMLRPTKSTYLLFFYFYFFKSLLISARKRYVERSNLQFRANHITVILIPPTVKTLYKTYTKEIKIKITRAPCVIMLSLSCSDSICCVVYALLFDVNMSSSPLLQLWFSSLF